MGDTVFFFLCAPEIWPDKRSGSWPDKRGDCYKIMYLLTMSILVSLTLTSGRLK